MEELRKLINKWKNEQHNDKMFFAIYDKFIIDAEDALNREQSKPLPTTEQLKQADVMRSVCKQCDGRGSTVIFNKCFMCESCNGSGLQTDA